MNTNKLLQAEGEFLHKHPDGFASPGLVAVGKKHNVGKMVEFTQQAFNKKAFANTEEVIQNWIKVVSRSSMVSLFEKPRFKEMASSLSPSNKAKFVEGLYQQLHGNEEKGFNAILDILVENKMTKWSIITIVPAYFKPKDQVFVKPTTAKGVIKVFELTQLDYKPKPSWAFYKEYRNQILAMKEMVSESLSPNNAAFSGFLMMTMEQV
ncbi:hypothetical protein [Reinekea sp.]|uniref:hypothetical protein n=1 Tax=Reinekea sp. TaxID=1970455 RepID=UPI003988BA2C